MFALPAVLNKFPGTTTSEFRGQTRVVVPAALCWDLLRTLKEEHEFDLLADVTCVDYLNYRDATDRYGMAYNVVRTSDNVRLIVRTFLNDPEPTIPTTTTLWLGADWMEREVYDMFGITFAGHPDHRRILCPDEFVAYPLRKDYPLQGRGERHNFPVLTRREA